MIHRKACVDVAWFMVFTNNKTGMLDRTVGEEQLTADDGGFGMGVGIAHERIDPPWLRYGVIVQKNQILATPQFRPLVQCLTKSTVFGICYYTDAILKA